MIDIGAGVDIFCTDSDIYGTMAADDIHRYIFTSRTVLASWQVHDCFDNPPRFLVLYMIVANMPSPSLHALSEAIPTYTDRNTTSEHKITADYTTKTVKAMLSVCGNSR